MMSDSPGELFLYPCFRGKPAHSPILIGWRSGCHICLIGLEFSVRTKLNNQNVVSSWFSIFAVLFHLQSCFALANCDAFSDLFSSLIILKSSLECGLTLEESCMHVCEICCTLFDNSFAVCTLRTNSRALSFFECIIISRLLMDPRSVQARALNFRKIFFAPGLIT